MNIEADIYELLVTAITQTLKGSKALTYSQIVEGIKKYLQQKKISFQKSISWYAVAVKNEMQVSGKIEVFMEKGKKLHKLVSVKREP